MQAYVLNKYHQPLQKQTFELPEPKPDQVLIQVEACGICRTDLHVVDGELAMTQLPIIPGHQIVGRVIAFGEKVTHLNLGQRVGVPWLGDTCHHCFYCKQSQENLCDQAKFTGCNIPGGFAEYTLAQGDFCIELDKTLAPESVAPLLCAGLIGYRALCKVPNAKKIAFYGFGASAHILAQVCKHQNREVYAVTKVGDTQTQAFAKKIGAVWSGDINQDLPDEMDAAIIFAPAGELVPLALKNIRKGGIVVCAGIHMSDIPSFPYDLLWGERKIESVANLTRQDGKAFFDFVAKNPIKTHTNLYALDEVNQALDDLRHGRFTGAAVLVL